MTGAEGAPRRGRAEGAPEVAGTLAIVGAGRGLGAAAARRFGAAGFSVGLIARDPARVAALATDLNGEGIRAVGHTADVRDRAGLVAALDRIAADLGPIEVLQFSPLPAKEFLKPPAETTADDLVAAVDFSLHATVAAVEQVLPGMRVLGRGTVLLANGGSSVTPRAAVTGTSVAFAAQAVYAQLLHETLAPEHVHVAQLVVGGAIVAGHPEKDPAVLAEHLWDLHDRRDRFRREIAA